MDVLKTYIYFKANPENDSKKDTLFCQEHSIVYKDLQGIKKANPDWRKNALDLRRETYAEKMTDVDEALFAAAIGGDTKAADLLYRRFDGWDPKVAAVTNNYYNFADLVKDAANGKSKPRTGSQTFRAL